MHCTRRFLRGVTGMFIGEPARCAKRPEQNMKIGMAKAAMPPAPQPPLSSAACLFAMSSPPAFLRFEDGREWRCARVKRFSAPAGLNMAHIQSHHACPPRQVKPCNQNSRSLSGERQSVFAPPAPRAVARPRPPARAYMVEGYGAAQRERRQRAVPAVERSSNVPCLSRRPLETAHSGARRAWHLRA